MGGMLKRYRKWIIALVVVFCLLGLAIAYRIFIPRQTPQPVAGSIIQMAGSMIVVRIDGKDPNSSSDDVARRFLVTKDTQVRDVRSGPGVKADAGLLRTGAWIVVLSSKPSATDGVDELEAADVLFAPNDGKQQ